MANTAPAPSGVLLAGQLATPPETLAVQSVRSPVLKVTVPVGVPLPPEMVAEYVICEPTVAEDGFADALRLVAVVVASSENTVRLPPESPPFGSPTAAVVPSAESATAVPNVSAFGVTVSGVPADQDPSKS